MSSWQEETRRVRQETTNLDSILEDDSGEEDSENKEDDEGASHECIVYR